MSTVIAIPEPPVIPCSIVGRDLPHDSAHEIVKARMTAIAAIQESPSSVLIGAHSGASLVDRDPGEALIRSRNHKNLTAHPDVPLVWGVAGNGMVADRFTDELLRYRISGWGGLRE